MFTKRNEYCKVIFLNLLVFLLYGCKSGDEDDKNWSTFLGDKSVSHYSFMQQIDTANVQQIKVALAYHTGDAEMKTHSQIECNPIIIKDILYGTSPQLKLFALDTAIGKSKWVFDPFPGNAKRKLNLSCGITYWSDGVSSRILYAAASYLYAIDIITGKPILTFGDQGKINLYDGLDRDVKNLFVTTSSPGIIYKDLLITGTRVAESGDVAPGHIRAYNVHTGERKWIFRTIPHPGELGYATWENKDAWKYTGGANSWSGMSLDEKRGVVYASTGSATYDFGSGLQKGQNLFANCVLALDAATGKYTWHYQTVHHDLWDMDNLAPPNLVTINRDGEKIDTVAQITKTGFVFVLDRDSGKPLFPVDEVSVPDSSTLVGEKPWPTQPVPRLPNLFVLSIFTKADINPFVSGSSQAVVRKRLAQLENGNHLPAGNKFLPPSEEGTMVFPGFGGGAEWGGAAYDPNMGYLYINASQIPCESTIVKKDAKDWHHTTMAEHGKRVYVNNCMTATDRIEKAIKAILYCNTLIKNIQLHRYWILLITTTA